MRYREVVPPPDLRQFVLAYWEFAISESIPGPFIHHIFPDGCASVSYGARSAQAPLIIAGAGPTTETRRVHCSPGDIFWGIRLQPAACRALLGCGPATLLNQRLPCAEINLELHHALLAEVKASTCFEQMVAGFSRALRAIKLCNHLIDSKAAAAADLIDRARGRARIADIAIAVKLSQRQLQRRFSLAVGLSPKQFARARRLRATALALVKTASTDWAGLAFEMGFTDQSHLTHEFGALTKESPVLFERRLRAVEHGVLLD
ncbi:MAG: AraC family transcriptional regulator [Verrucomicrobia bacterium]|nr:AraC family transcriptional regulator [Verrucomicrobiota bacterium]